MSENASSETLIVCPNDDDDQWIERVYIGLALVGALASFATFLMQRRQERQDGIEAQEKEDDELDRQQALERVRQQLSMFVGPMHRLWKTQNTMHLRFLKSMDYHFDWKRISKFWSENEKTSRLGFYWTPMFPEEIVAPILENHQCRRAVLYRNFVNRQLKPVYTQIRTLILHKMSDLADMPTQEEWLKRFPDRNAITSPYTGSLNINVVFDSYTAWTYEFDDIIESWEEGDYTRVQPFNKVCVVLCNDLIDILYERAKEKEAKYNRHVSVHKNMRQLNSLDALNREAIKSVVPEGRSGESSSNNSGVAEFLKATGA